MDQRSTAVEKRSRRRYSVRMSTRQVMGCAAVALVLCAGCRTTSAAKSPAIMTWAAYTDLQRSGRHPAWPYIVRLDSRPGRGRGALLYFGAAQEAVKNAGEPGLVRFLAARDNVPTTTLDPSLAQQVAAMSRTFTREQLKVFFVLRAVSQHVQRQGKHDLPKETERVLRVFTATPGLSGSPRTIDELQAAYARFFPEAGTYDDVQPAWFNPVSSGTFLNDISRELNNYRDELIVQLIVHHVSNGQRVFAVVGGSHVVMQEAALRATLAR
jgi:hypothetical protein